MGTAVCEMLGRGFGIAFADCLTSLRLVGRSTASAWKFQNNCVCTTVCARRGSDRDRPTKRRPCFPLARSIELTTATDGISLNILRWTVIRRSLHKVFVVEFSVRRTEDWARGFADYCRFPRHCSAEATARFSKASPKVHCGRLVTSSIPRN